VVVTKRSCDVRDHNNNIRGDDNSVCIDHNCKIVISVVIMDVFVIK
jgi:hypothetical protein